MLKVEIAAAFGLAMTGGGRLLDLRLQRDLFYLIWQLPLLSYCFLDSWLRRDDNVLVGMIRVWLVASGRHWAIV